MRIKKGKNFPCKICKKVFYRNPAQIKKGIITYCSLQCAGIDKRNKFLRSYDPKVELTCEKCGKKKKITKDHFNRSLHHYCSQKCANQSIGLKNRGKNHYNFSGGQREERHRLRQTTKYYDWCKAVYKRDYWTCQHCKKKVKAIIAHHLKSFKNYLDLRFDVNNGITLCRSCHKKVHIEIGLDTRFTHLDIHKIKTHNDGSFKERLVNKIGRF